MCYYIGSDVVLANLLYYRSSAQDKGVSFPEIEKYCEAIKLQLLKSGRNKTDYISFGINRDELNNDVEMYPDEFRKFQNRYYNIGIKIEPFKLRLVEELSDIMESVAKKL